ncbi:MAG: AraC family transcriptional regulator [Myxococcales bacterium]|nr:AraC family transcriptional regulator [Myxococcales bacterium]
MTTAIGLVRAVVRTASAAALPIDAMLVEHEIDPGLLNDRDARVSTDRYLALFEDAARQSKSRSFGGDVARHIDAAAFGLLGFVVASCSTLDDAWLRFGRYTRLLCDELRFDVEDRGDDVAVVYGLDADPRAGTIFEMAFAHLVSTSRKGTAGRFAPRLARLRHRGDASAVSSVLGAPVEFGAPENAVVCDRSVLRLPLRGANPALLDVLESHVGLVLESFAPVDDFVARVRHEIRMVLHHGEPSLKTIATRMAIGDRTLQRRLKDEGLTFRAVIDQVRFECARTQLENPAVSVAEVAYSLGFSSPSAFHVAYRRWAGESPGRSRARS